MFISNRLQNWQSSFLATILYHNNFLWLTGSHERFIQWSLLWINSASAPTGRIHPNKFISFQKNQLFAHPCPFSYFGEKINQEGTYSKVFFWLVGKLPKKEIILCCLFVQHWGCTTIGKRDKMHVFISTISKKWALITPIFYDVFFSFFLTC